MTQILSASPTRLSLSAFRASVLGRMISTPLGALGTVLLLVLLLFAFVGPVLSPYDPAKLDIASQHQSPSATHWLGTDFYGRDILTRIMEGIRLSMLLAVTVEGIALVIGVTIGLIAGYSGGILDSVLMRVTDGFIVIPIILFALTGMSILGPSFWALVLVLAAREWTSYARLSRAEALSIRERDFVAASIISGGTVLRQVVGHVLPNLAGTLVVFSTLALSTPILLETALSFLGLGLPNDVISLGTMIAGDRNYLRVAWWAVTFPGLAIAATVLAFNLVGDALRDALDPRSKGR